MFNALFDILSAWNALLYLLAGGAVGGLGLLVVGYTIYVRVTERAYRGQIVSVESEGAAKNMYWPLVAYTDDQGRRHQGLANTGSSLIAGRTPGANVTVLAAPAALMLAGDWWVLFCIGLFVLAVASPFVMMGLHSLRFTWGTLVVVLGILGYGGFRLFPLVHPFLDARKAGTWTAAREAFNARVQARQNMQPVSSADLAAASTVQTQHFAKAAPVLMALGLVLVIAGAFWFQHQTAFLGRALSANGIVLRNETTEDSDNKPSFHAVVAFTDRSGRELTVRDSLGTSPAWFSAGDKVKVFYSPQNSADAKLDRGIWNWLVPLLIAALGTLMLGGGLYGFAARRTAQQQ